ncbi:TonB-dependent receptor [Parabacteroides sp. FAFU027]|uniref:TonB-dependent receptor n=1 Tax=Parabacteroides sp. FAFU027 TaxID=2922715 RepID=UPI001FAF8BEB|nr:TonB-dependent receptor plug domain-containing protein [Parabacteroides sp. FAFU027]
MIKRVKYIIPFLFPLFSLQVSALPADTLKVKSVTKNKEVRLQEVSVNGFRQEKLKAKNAVILTPKDISAVASENFINVVDQLPGIVKVNETTFPLLIRGMYGSRIHVEKNGMVKTGIDQSGYKLEDINPNDVSDVQLLHGARSIAYGNGSVGGVLLINEKLSFKKKGFNGNAKLAYGSNNNEQTADTRFCYANSSNVFTVGGRYTLADNFHYPDQVEALNSAYSYKNLSTKLAHKFKGQSIIEWDNNYYSGQREKPLGFQNNPYDYRTFFDRYNIESSLKFRTTIANGTSVNTNLWYNGLNTDQRQDQVNAGTKLLAIREMIYSFKQAGGFKVNASKKIARYWVGEAGADAYTDYLCQDHGTDDIKHNTSSLYKYYSEQQQTIGGIYGIAEYEKEKHQIGLSLRGDYGNLKKDSIHSKSYYNVTGGIDWSYKFRPWLQNDLSLSRHFRFPIPMEAIGVFYGGRGTFVGNPDIEPETCYNIEWVVKGELKHLMYTLNGWASFFHNRISEYELFTNKYTYINIAKARLYGFDGSLTAFTGDKKRAGKAELTINATYAYGDDVTNDGYLGKGSPLEGIPPGRIRNKLQYYKSWKNVEPSVFIIFSYIASYDRLPEYSVTKTWGQNARNAYPLWDAGLNIHLPKALNGTTFSLLVNNMLDTSYLPYGGYLRGIGRNFKTTVNVRF